MVLLPLGIDFHFVAEVSINLTFGTALPTKGENNYGGI
jgi:hypothetical protein